MPRTLVRAPQHDRARSLGWLAGEWIEYFVLHGRGDATGMRVEHVDEFAGFVADCYALDANGRMLYDASFFSRPKGCDKSGLGSRFALFDALGPSRFAGFAEGGEEYRDPWGMGFSYVYEPGEPMGRHIVKPVVRVLATEEGQTGNVYDSIYYNLSDEDAPLSQIGADAGLARISLPGGGEIRPSTAASASKDGGLETLVIFDETHLYNTPELRRMYDTVTRNLVKRKRTAGTWYLETTTMFARGEESVAEATYELAEAIQQGRAKRQRTLYDHRWGECDDLTDETALRAALLDAFGDAIAWNDLDGLVDEFYNPRKHVDDSRRYFLNAMSAAVTSWMAPEKWEAVKAEEIRVQDGERITLGFDGAVTDDATALVACRVSDGHLFVPEYGGVPTIWQKPVGPDGQDWRVDGELVDAAVADVMTRYQVVGMYADPPYWQTYVDRWESLYGRRMRVRANQHKPIEWWTNRPTAMVAAAHRLFEAVGAKQVTHSGDVILRQHVLNARRRLAGKVGITIGKEYAKSPKKIDAAMAAILAYECRGDAVARGLDRQRKRTAGAF